MELTSNRINTTTPNIRQRRIDLQPTSITDAKDLYTGRGVSRAEVSTEEGVDCWGWEEGDEARIIRSAVGLFYQQPN